jgi:hypothetical protein
MSPPPVPEESDGPPGWARSSVGRPQGETPVGRRPRDGENASVEWDQVGREGVEVALNEADVVGLRPNPDAAWLDVLVHVLALPERGPLDPDARRIIRLLGPRTVKVPLRTDAVDGRYGPPIELADLDAVETFFATLSWGGSLCGWRFLDDPSLTGDWPQQTSLTVQLQPGPGTHSFYWFNECGHDHDGQVQSLCIEGTVTFDDLLVMRADGNPIPIEEFIADGQRHWAALRAGDERLSVQAQRTAQAGTPKWRTWALGATTVTGTLTAK